MIGTEEQAREWWCPMVRVGAGNNRPLTEGASLAECNCIAGKCAMWRRLPAFARRKADPDGPRYDSLMAKRYPDEYEMEPRRGYCGLAPLPQE